MFGKSFHIIELGWSLNHHLQAGEHPYLLSGQIHSASSKSHDFSGADGHDEGSSKHPMDSAVDYAAESSAFRELCSDKIFNWQHCLGGRKGCSFKQSSSPHQPVMPDYLEIRLGEPGTSSMPTASFVGRTVDLVPQERLLRRC